MFEYELTTQDVPEGRFAWAEGRGATAGDAMEDVLGKIKYLGPRRLVGVRIALTCVPEKAPIPAHVAVVLYGTIPD